MHIGLIKSPTYKRFCGPSAYKIFQAQIFGYCALECYIMYTKLKYVLLNANI